VARRAPDWLAPVLTVWALLLVTCLIALAVAGSFYEYRIADGRPAGETMRLIESDGWELIHGEPPILRRARFRPFAPADAVR
jgi:hypothetical protein